ncbi:hypothetical protein XELAEV_18011973mg [Xenopus laevis]|uniref:Uncharacterized protein n=1 Tax=Xenopus laevis TaxID=8355 RepID=A0A974DN76_XENLA|nr:hypothetical protein XELAEV_18011973mg [Xenopus laevis]
MPIDFNAFCFKGQGTCNINFRSSERHIFILLCSAINSHYFPAFHLFKRSNFEKRKAQSEGKKNHIMQLSICTTKTSRRHRTHDY